MDFGDIPDDIWISIFEQIEDPSTLAVLVRTCRRFYGLSSKLLLRELKWLKPELTLRNIEAWAGVYSTVAALPRKITIGVPFEFAHAMRPSVPCVSSTITAEMKLHDLIYMQLLRFTSITEICLDGTVISPYSYCVLGEIPTLRSLLLEDCTFINLHFSFGTRAINQFPSHFFETNTHPPQPAEELACPLEIISLMPIQHLSLHRVMVPSEYENYRYHPLCLITIPTLTSLSIIWNTSIAARYAQNRWALPSLTDLSVVLPLMSRDLLDELAIFVHKCELSPRFKLKIEKHNLSDTQMATVQVPSSGLWNYEGPLAIVAGSATQSSRPTLTHVKINETLELPPLLDGLEKLPLVIEELEVQVGKWDIELLFAIKELFKGIRKLVVRYVRGGLPENLLVRLGADILFCLPDLVSIRLLGPIKSQPDTNPERSSVTRSISSSSPPVTGTSVGSPNTSSLGRIHSHGPASHVSVFHNVLLGRGLGMTQTRSGYHDDLDFNADDFECTLDMEQAEVRAHPTSISSSAPSLQTNHRPWNSTSSLRHSSVASSSSALNTTSTYRPSISSSNRIGGVFAKKQGSPERQNSNSSDAFEPASPLSQAELGDYLIGWNRYCPSLRAVQIDQRWWWERRFAGDQWALHVHRRGSDKGKEREDT